MIIYIFFLVVLIATNGILASSEIAYLSLDKYIVSKKRDKKSKMITNIINDESKFLSTIQIGITLAGFLASAITSDFFTDKVINEYNIILINEHFSEIFFMIIFTFILAYINLVFGELFPKRIARSNPEMIAYNFVYVIHIISKLFYPLISFLTASTNLLCRIFDIKERNESLSEKDIKRMIVLGSKEGVLEEKEKEYILNIFKFNDKSVYKIMIPREKCIYFDINDDIKNILSIMRNSKYTRYPVLDRDKILGFVNVKEFIYLHKDYSKIDLKSLIHKCPIFNKNEKIDDVFRIMQSESEVFSIIVDNGEFIGILTAENAVEEIVGKIEDEYYN